MTAMMILDPGAPGCPVHQIKCADQFKMLFDPRRPMNEGTGRAMAEWARGGGNSAEEKSIMERARDEARKGREAFTAFWNSDFGKANRAILRAIQAELADIATAADEAKAREGDDPFGLPPLDAQPDPLPPTATDDEI
jgi:hypothetical protein